MTETIKTVFGAFIHRRRGVDLLFLSGILLGWRACFDPDLATIEWAETSSPTLLS
jgi:hypothetical protein